MLVILLIHHSFTSRESIFILLSPHFISLRQCFYKDFYRTSPLYLPSVFFQRGFIILSPLYLFSTVFFKGLPSYLPRSSLTEGQHFFQTKTDSTAISHFKKMDCCRFPLITFHMQLIKYSSLTQVNEMKYRLKYYKSLMEIKVLLPHQT